MKKLLLTLMLAVVSSSAMAEWVEIVHSTDGNYFYADPTTIEKAGDRVTMWVLADYGAKQSNKTLSSEVHMQFDCKKEQDRVLYLASFPGNMAAGKQLHGSANDNPNWNQVNLAGIDGSMWKYACGK